MVSLSIIVPVYNEASFLDLLIGEQIQQLRRLDLPFELILCENGSQDQTLALARSLAKKYQQIRVLSLSQPDYGAAVRKGFLAGRNKYLVLFDLDYFDADFVRQALPLLQKNCAVVADKRGNGSQDQRSLLRRLATGTFSFLLKTLFGLQISDTHGMKILDRKKFIPVINTCHFNRDIFDTELLIRGEHQGLKIAEVGVVVKERRKSRSSILKRSLRTLGDLAKLKAKLLIESGGRKTIMISA